MGKFSATLRDSFEIFSREPKFILPKLVIAFLYSILILYTADLALDVLVFSNPDNMMPLLVTALILFGSTIVVSLADIFVGSMYPIMVEQVRKTKKLGLRKSFSDALAGAKATMPSIIVVELLFLALSFVISIPLSIFIVEESDYFVLFSMVYVGLLVAVVFFFYLIYPVVVFEKRRVVDSLKRSVQLSMDNAGEIVKATMVSFLLSGLSFVLAFAIEFFPASESSPLFWVAFVVVRFLTAYVYSYLFVLNPVFYFNYAGARK